MRKKKIIIVNTVGLSYDGITSVILTYLQAMDLDKFDIHVVSTIKCEDSIKKKILELGCQVVELPSRNKETIKYLFSLIRYIRLNRIEIIHAHGNSATLTIEMFAGVIGGCKKRIAHSHNTQCSQVRTDKLLRPLFYRLYTDAFACGRAAGEWLFGKNEFRVLNNGRNLQKFAFDSDVRKKMRTKYGITEELVIGHVGGFNPQKNHEFVLKIFKEIIKIEPKTKCFFIGDGPLKSNIEKKAEKISKNVFFVGTTDVIADYLDMMDGMIFPSLFEGLPLVVLEWQINGLPSILSDTITSQCAVASDVKFMSLKLSPEEWAREILKLSSSCLNIRYEKSLEGQKKVKQSGFDISENAKLLEQVYLA